MPTNKLTHLAVTNLVKAGKKARTGDGGGLWLDVRAPGRGAWVFRYARNGASREIGLGGCGDVSLVDVRQLAGEHRSLIAKGIDPLAQREVEAIARKVEEEAKRAADNADKRTFKFAADQRMAAKGSQYRNAKHRQQWANTLATYVYPVFGDTPVNEITSDDVLRALQPIWETKPETATRVRQRIEAVLYYAAASKWRSGPNPAVWRGDLSELLSATNKTSRVRHHPALPWARLPDMMAVLKQVPGMGALALRFAILTAARSGEVRGAHWGEIDFDGGVWTVPASRMKSEREHRVPLSSEALNVLAQARPYRQSDEKNALVFPGIKVGKRLSDMTLGAVIKRLNSRGTPTWVDAFELAKVLPRGGVVFIDTLNRAAPTADENSSVDMGKILEGMSRVQALTQGLVIVVHHTGKDTSRGLRGHSSLHAALDAAIEVERTGDKHSNQVLRYWLGVQLDNALAMPPHRAGPDAYVTAYVLANYSRGPDRWPRPRIGRR